MVSVLGDCVLQVRAGRRRDAAPRVPEPAAPRLRELLHDRAPVRDGDARPGRVEVLQRWLGHMVRLMCIT